MKTLLWGILALLLMYTVLPFALTRVLRLGVVKRGDSRHDIVLTFDDGPDPEYTPHLLQVLKRHGVKATFFVLGSKAERHPDLIRQMHEEGHLIGIHGYVHQCNWLLPPWTVRRYVNRSADVIEKITGVRPTFYRPTWGLLNVCDLLFLRGYNVVLWTVMVSDWRTKVARKELRERLLRRMHGGDIVVLHDSGETFGADDDAPKYMIHALEEVLQAVRHYRYRWLTVGEMMQEKAQAEALKPQLSWQKKLLVWLWLKYEVLFQKVFQIKAFDENNPFIHYRVRKYQGEPMVLEDGAEIRKGDLVAELHFDNEMLFDFTTQSRSSAHLAIQMIRRMEALMPQMAHHAVYSPEFEHVKALYGVTMVNRGPQKLGFTVLDLANGVFSFFTKIYLKFLMSVLHPSGKERLQSQRSNLLVPKAIVMSRAELLRRYHVEPIYSATKREVASNEMDDLNEFNDHELNELILPH